MTVRPHTKHPACTAVMVLGALCCAGAAGAQNATSLTEVTVEAQPLMLEKRVAAFVREVTQDAGVSDQESLVRWNVPICLLARGLSTNESRGVLARLSHIIGDAGAPLAREPCQPNFIIVATSEPDRVLQAWYSRDNQLFGTASASEIRRFIETPRLYPVRVWRNIDRGRIAGMRFGHFVPSNSRAESSPFVWNAVRSFQSIFAIIDSRHVESAKAIRLADYIAMAGLSNVDLDADIGNAPSILRLFAASGVPPSELTTWDAAFLRALYQSDQTSRGQRYEIAERVIREVSR